MAISRGSIHHSVVDDLSALLQCYCNPRTNLNKPSSDIRLETIQSIESFFPSCQATLFPFARTAFYAVLRALSLPPGSSILLTPYNISPMKEIILALGYRPVFVDINLSDYGPIETDLAEQLAQQPGCFFLTYLFGYVPNIAKIATLCKRYNVPLIEDISQCIGAKYNGQLLGTFGLASIYSASLTKYVDAYNGAFALASDQHVIQRLQRFCNTELSPPAQSRVQKIILKTTIWNIALTHPFFALCVMPLLRLVKFFNPVYFESLLGPSIKPSCDTNLPDYYFEDLSHIQCIKLKFYITALPKLLKHRAFAAGLANRAYQNILGNSCKSSFHENVSKNWWQFVVEVENVAMARDILFRHGIETGTTNLPDLSMGTSFKLQNASLLKLKRLFVPLHSRLTLKDYESLFVLLKKHSLISLTSESKP